MKSRFLALYVVIALLSFTMAALAWSQTTNSAPQATAGCCKKGGESCRMKDKAKGDGEHGKASCCKKEGGEGCSCGDACQMKADGTGCGCGCRESCSMKKGEGNPSNGEKPAGCGCGKNKPQAGAKS